MRSYGRYCPIARAAEIVAERWTPIIVRNLLAGCTTYTEISAGAPGLSRSVLTQRLRLLEHVGADQTAPKSGGRGVPTSSPRPGVTWAGVMTALGRWGERWVELGDEHTNPCVVLWCVVHRLP